MSRTPAILLLAFPFLVSPYSNRKPFPAPVTVTIKQLNGGYHLFIDDEPYYIRGAGGYDRFDILKKFGGNSVRIWTADWAHLYLDKAQQLGLTVTLGLHLELERHGFNYDDEQKVKAQFERVKKEILAYKDHPALLMWGIGNELDQFAGNYNVWNAVKDIVHFIHQVDPHHPTTTMLAGANKDHIREIVKRCPDLDVLSINAFKDVPWIRSKMLEAGWTGPYLIGEWGATGYWESEKLPWGAFLEETSTEKAKACEERYRVIASDTSHCLGSYVYYWGYKQARTHTLLSLFLETGEQTETIDMLHRAWSGKFPANRSPSIQPLVIDNKSPHTGTHLEPGSIHTALTNAMDPENDKLTYVWEIYHESQEQKEGGDLEKKPETLGGLILEQQNNRAIFKAPAQSGPYRLFVYALDGNNHAAFANFPFYVK